MNLDNPFETFEESAFRLEALPQYLVENEKIALGHFISTGKLPKFFDSEWRELVKKNIQSGKTMHRLRLLSDELTDYEKFETQIYTGSEVGEEIRANLRSAYADKYQYDFWLFDNYWIAEVIYENDGTFVRFDLRVATKDELEYAKYWLNIFEHSKQLVDFLYT